jgi:hypothetical protein
MKDTSARRSNYPRHAAQSKGEGENRVLPFDHLQRETQIVEEWHATILQWSTTLVALHADAS